VDRVSRNARYGGLALTPQLALIPLGADPRSGFEEFADPLTGEVPERGTGGELVCRQQTAVVFVLLPGGEFIMGAQKDDPRGRNYDAAATYIETPPHIVRLDPFLLGKHELTQAQWHAVMGGTERWWQPGRAWSHHRLAAPRRQCHLGPV
jgi:formylglycine-generating enzyme required for sulfatase activity